eukprot:scaffold47733_cov69-Phaeocystis_antarctica.AAC.3
MVSPRLASPSRARVERQSLLICLVFGCGCGIRFPSRNSTQPPRVAYSYSYRLPARPRARAAARQRSRRTATRPAHASLKSASYACNGRSGASAASCSRSSCGVTWSGLGIGL